MSKPESVRLKMSIPRLGQRQVEIDPKRYIRRDSPSKQVNWATKICLFVY